MTKKLIEGREI